MFFRGSQLGPRENQKAFKQSFYQDNRGGRNYFGVCVFLQHAFRDISKGFVREISDLEGPGYFESWKSREGSYDTQPGGEAG